MSNAKVSEISAADVLAFMQANPTFLADMKRLAKRVEIVKNKTLFTEDENIQNFLAKMDDVAAEFADNVNKSGTSGQHRIAIMTEFGHLTVVLEPSKSED